MGNAWEVEIWIRDAATDGYYWDQVYRGESRRAAMRAARKARRDGQGCIRMTWRPS